MNGYPQKLHGNTGVCHERTGIAAQIAEETGLPTLAHRPPLGRLPWADSIGSGGTASSLGGNQRKAVYTRPRENPVLQPSRAMRLTVKKQTRHSATSRSR